MGQPVSTQLRSIRAEGQDADHLTFVPDGEPTLDSRLDETVEALAGLGVPIAVITNSSLLWRADVRARVSRADLVSVKVDSARQASWRQLNRPHRELSLDVILQGIRDFAGAYPGTLISETMLVAGITDSDDSLNATADFLSGIAPRTAYLAAPIRPPAVAGTHGPDDAGLVRAYRIFSERLPSVELLTGHEAGAFAHTGDARQDLLAITAVHPMREVALRRLVAEDGAGWDLVESLLADGVLRSVEHEGQRFYLRPVRRRT